jgi:hypothetical protein
MDDSEARSRDNAAELELAAEGDDGARLRYLDELYRSLEAELDRDVEQTSPPRH